MDLVSDLSLTPFVFRQQGGAGGPHRRKVRFSTMPSQTSIPLCNHIKDDGVQCGSPALRGKGFCYFHQRQRRLRPTRMIPILEDKNSIQFAATQIVRAVLEDKVDNERLRLMLYALQIASSNLTLCDLPGVNPPISNPDIREARVARSPSAAASSTQARVARPPSAGPNQHHVTQPLAAADLSDQTTND